MSNVGDNLSAQNADWSFGNETARHFDSHVSRSVPFYKEGHDLICHLSDFFVKKDSLVYDIGTSTGEIPLMLSKHNRSKPKARFIGIDVEEEMIKIANEKRALADLNNVEFITDDVTQHSFEPCDLLISYYAVQFIRPSERQNLINKLYKTLKWGGALLLFEKVRANDARFQDIATGIYTEFKLAQGYTSEEIFHKARSLKGILEPFSTEGNRDLLKRAGFVDIMTVMKYVCFEGFLAIK